MISCDVHEIDFGDAYCAQSTAFPTKLLCISNAFDSFVQFSNNFIYSGGDFSVKIVLKSEDEKNEQIRISPNQSVKVVLQIFPENLTQQYLNKYKYNSTVNIPFTVEGSSNDCEQSLQLRYSVTLCTSVMFINQTDIDFQTCPSFESVTRDFEVWNRSDCELVFLVDSKATVHSNSKLNIKTEPKAVFVLEESDSNVKILGNTQMCILPFASKRITVRFEAQGQGQFSADIVLTNMNNSNNILTLHAKAVVQSAVQQEEYLVELFGEEESDSNILLLNADIGDASVDVSHNFDVGDCYGGVKKFKRCWLRNTSADRVEVVVMLSGDPNIGRSSDDTHVFYASDEVVVETSGHIPDATFAYSQTVATYNRTHSPDVTLSDAGVVGKPTQKTMASITPTTPETASAENMPKPIPVDVTGRYTPQSILVSDAKRQLQGIATRSRNVSFSSNNNSTDSVDVAKSTVSVGSYPPEKDGAEVVVFVSVDQAASKQATTQTRPSAQTVQKLDRPVGVSGPSFDAAEPLHDKATPWGLHKQSKAGKSITTSSTSSVTNGGSVGNSGKSSTSSYANDHGVTCGKLWGEAGLCQTLLDDEECLDPADKSLSPAVILGGAVVMEGGGLSNRRFFIGKSTRSLLRSRNQKSSKKPASVAIIPPAVVLASDVKVVESVGDVSLLPHVPSTGDKCDFVQQDDTPKAIVKSGIVGLMQDNMCAVIILEPFERRACTFIVTPSVDYFDINGACLSGILVNRSLGIILRCQKLSLVETVEKKEAQEIHLSLRLRVCSSVVSVTPQLYDLGLCSVGEFRWVIFSVQNDSDLPALIYSFVQSETLSIPEPELFIPPRKSKQLKIEYVAHQENTMYNKKAMLLNVFNENNHNQVEIRAKNVDTQQVLLHSLFYKLITYNNKRQLQVYFERGLINMPNLRTFCVKNTHSAVLRVEFTVGRGRFLQLFQLKSVEQIMRDQSDNLDDVSARSATPATGTRPFKLPRFNDFNVEDFVDDGPTAFLRADKVAESSVATKFSPSVATTAMNQHIEDLKWGDENDNNRLQRVSKSASMRMSGGGLDDEFHLTKSQKMSRLNQTPLSSDLDALDVNVSTVSSGISSGISGGGGSLSSKNVAENMGASSSRVVTVDPSILSVNSPGVITVQGNKTAGESSSSSKLSPKASKDEGEDCFLASTKGSSSQRFLDLIQELDKGDFPHCFLRQYSTNEDLADGELTASQESSRDFDSNTKSNSDRDNSVKTQQEVERQVKAIQRTYTDLKALLDNKGTVNSCLVPLPEVAGVEQQVDVLTASTDAEQNNTRSFVVDIPIGATVNFAVVLFPQQARVEDQNECHLAAIDEAIQIRLPQITSSDIDTAIKSNHQLNDVQLLSSHLTAPSGPIGHDLEKMNTAAAGGYPLKSRSMLVRAKAVRCEMIVIQKNISFGRTLVGDKTSRVVTVVNRSSIACLFSISKSGSISSGFLQIPQGRHGVIPAYSTKHVEFIFRPTLPGSFEETMLIENVLNPRNTQSIVVKAKVSKAESFVLLAHNEGPSLTRSDSRIQLANSSEEPVAAVSEVPSEEFVVGIGEHNQAMDSDSFYRGQLDDAMMQISKIGTAVVGVNALSIVNTPVFLGSVAVGEQCETVVSFRIKNQTSKKRQFIVDSTHPTAVSLLASAVLSARTQSVDLLPFSTTSSPSRKRPPLKPSRSKSGSVLESMTTSGILHSLPFEPIAEILQSVVSLSCTFSSSVWSSADKGGKTSSGQESSLSDEQRLALEDSLEKFQQKLKIAVRKNKTDKIEKYQKKINKVIASLTGVKEESATLDTELNGTGLAAVVSDPIGSDDGAGLLVASAKPITSTPTAIQSAEESDVAYHFSLEADQEKVISVKLTFLPAASYSQWSGVLPFLGFLRVFECRNEDTVKCVHFGAMVYSSRVAFGAAALERRESLGDFECLSIDEEMSEDCANRKRRSGSQEFKAAARRLESKPSFRRDILQDSAEVGDNDEATLSSLTHSRDRLSLSSIVELQKVENSFLVTVAQWSSFPTKLIYPKYRQLPQNVLGMSVKLVQASKDRVMYGALSLASVLLQRDAVIDLFVEDSFNVKSSSDYIAYNSKLHGAISFGLASNSTVSDNSTNHISYHDSVGSDEAVRYFDSKIQTQVSAGGKLLFVVKWRPPIEEQRTELNLLGAFKVQCRVKDKVVGTEQFVPFICVREHKSVLRVERYSSFGDITVGSYRMASVVITNTSPTEDLHYLVSSEDITASARAVGKVQINSGQTGVVPPSSSRTMSLLFSATSPGKFEQKLWIRNISDGFDQKRIAIQANVTITHAKFVTFPDLEHSLDSNEGKYKPIDLGLIQIQNQNVDVSHWTNVCLQQHVVNDDFYRLRIENVSDNMLNVTAISNLKSQCLVYVDEACTQLAVNHPMPHHACTTLFVLIRPAQLQSKSSDWISSAVPKPISSGLVGLTASKTALDLTTLSTNILSVDSLPSKNLISTAGGGTGRELKGGIRLVFFVSDPISSVAEGESPRPSEVVQRKLFETALSFKAIVGKSVLKLKSTTPTLQCIKARNSDCGEDSEDPIHQVARGAFEIRNDSTVFPLRYSYVVDSVADCVGEPREDWLTTGEQLFSSQENRKNGNERLKLLIADTIIGVLMPGQSRLIDFAVFYSSEVATARSGLGLFDIRMINLSTKDTCHVRLGMFFDCDQVRGTITGSVDPDHVDDIPVLNVSSPVWLAGLDNRTRGKRLRRKLQRRNKSSGVDDEDNDAFELTAGSDGETESVGSSVDVGATLLWYEITGAAANVLCSCVIRNTHAQKLLTLTPVSDLPLVVHTEPLEIEQGGIDPNCPKTASIDDKTGGGAWQAVIKHQNQLSSVVVGKWKRNICIRGEAFTLPPKCAVRVTISAPRGMLLDEELVDEIQRVKLESGNQCKVVGMVAFLQSAHSLQSLFDQTAQAGLQGMFLPPPLIPSEVGNSAIVSTSQLESLFVSRPTPLSTDSSPTKPVSFQAVADPTSTIITRDTSQPPPKPHQQFEIFPLLSMFKINCSFVVPKLQIPCSVFALGKLRAGYQTVFDITVVNLSEVDVPCSVECLPSWLTLHPSNFLAGGAFYFSSSTIGHFNDPSRDDEAFVGRTRKNTWTSLSSSTIDIIDASTPIRSSGVSSLGAKKMQMWLNRNGAGAETATSPEVLAVDDESVGNLSDLSSLAMHQKRFAPNKDDFHVDTAMPQFSSASSADCGGRFDEEVDIDMDVRSMTSLDVHHESVFAASLIDAIGSLDAELLPPRYREGTSLFSAKKSSRTVLKLLARAPFVETQRLEHKIRIKNLTSCSSPYFTSASDFEVLVRLDVDSTKAIEVSGGPNDPLVVSAVRYRGVVNTPLMSPKASNVSGNMFSPERSDVSSAAICATGSSQSISLYRLLKEPFLVPPPVVAGPPVVDNMEIAVLTSPTKVISAQQFDLNTESGTRDTTLNPVSSGILMSRANRANFKLASEAKTHCIVFLKNNLSRPVRVSAVLALNPALAKVLSMHVKFPQSGEQSDCLVLQPKETAEVKIRVSGKIGSRSSDIDHAQLATYLLLNTTKPEQSQFTEKVDNVDSAHGFPLCGPVLFGTVNFQPSVVLEKPSVSLGRERSKSAELSVSAVAEESGRRQPSGLSIAMSDSEEDAQVAPQDLVSVDVVGFLSAGPTVAVNRLVKQPIGGLIVTSQRNSMFSDLRSSADGGANIVSGVNELGDLLIFRVTEDAVQTSQTTMPSPFSRRFRMCSDEQCFYINNPSPNIALNFNIKSGSYRHPGMQLFLPDVPRGGTVERSQDDLQVAQQGQEGYYDTVTVQATPSRGTILPGGWLLISVSMLPGVSGGSVRTTSTMTSISDIPDKLIRAIARGERTSILDMTALSAENSDGELQSTGIPRIDTAVLACMPLQISDEDWPQHPPRKVFTYLISDSVVSTQPSQPPSDIRDARRPSIATRSVSGIRSDAVEPLSCEINQTSLFNAKPSVVSSASDSTTVELSGTGVLEASCPLIRLRGVRPFASRVISGSCYMIDLKQQPQRKESIEWLVSVENCSSTSCAVPYSVFASDQSWLTVGQSKGVAAVGSSSDIMVYLNRTNVGFFSAYVVVRNGLDPFNNQIICVSMEVVSVGDTNVGQRKVSLSSANQITTGGASIDGESIVPLEASVVMETLPTVEVPVIKAANDGFRIPNLFRSEFKVLTECEQMSELDVKSVDIFPPFTDATIALELMSDCDMPLMVVVTTDSPSLVISSTENRSTCSGFVNTIIPARHFVSLQISVHNAQCSAEVDDSTSHTLKKIEKVGDQWVEKVTLKVELPLFGEFQELSVFVHRKKVDICT